jgi:hypothetical protein
MTTDATVNASVNASQTKPYGRTNFLVVMPTSSDRVRAACRFAHALTLATHDGISVGTARQGQLCLDGTLDPLAEPDGYTTMGTS